MDVYAQIAARIIEKQETIIGPVAIEQAEQVANLQLNWDAREVNIAGDGAHVIDELVGKYRDLFGAISVEVCREAAARFLPGIPQGEQPKSLV